MFPGLLCAGLATEHQRLAATAAQVTPSLANHAVTLGGEREVAVRAWAAINVTRHAAALNGVGMAAIGRQLVDTAHDQLPLFAMRLNTATEQLMGNQVRDFVRHGLAQEIFGVLFIELRIEAQQVFVQVRDASLLAAQLKTDHRPFERAFEEGFGLLITGFDAGIELFGHALWLSSAPSMPQGHARLNTPAARWSFSSQCCCQFERHARSLFNPVSVMRKMIALSQTTGGYLQQMGTLSVNQNKLQKRLRRLAGEAVADFNMIEDGDKVMVCLSGGKDSYTLLDVLLHLQKVAPIRFDIVAVNMDQKQPGFPEHVLPAYLKALGVEYHIVEKDTYSVVKELIPEGKTTCSLCSRLRRGTLYTFADEIGATKMALGHHRDDIVETFFLNMFFNGSLKAMPPKLRADDGRNVVIRPLAYCHEKDIQAYSDLKQFPIIPCNLCGSQENLQRQVVKDMLLDWERKTPGRTESIFRALQNVQPSQLADRKLFDFSNLRIDETAASRFVNVVNI
ncbi:tRNA 2-thiocytidine biosynthesis protein TtcA [Pseudomonas syringae pv. philadelphi]|uniref:tRNA-cytidine(32) 2-sulfurtransferase n=4 Tax=Pseudomonas syringae group TaxID=136849 RepID=A0A3M3YNG1_9PSED|nr:tRNA 2-thiocytidine biosynthesis protein TtcA [Pseudomonas syringae pv. philadelphi]